MLKIALCDDAVLELRQLEIQINKYVTLHPERKITYHSFQSSEELLPCISEGAFQIYLLDIIMDENDGIAIGNAIRSVDEEAVIIYTTVSPDYVTESYDVAAFHYLIKPINMEKLHSVLDHALKRFDPVKEYLSIRTAGMTKSVPFKNIVFIEYHSHSLSYHMENGSHITSLSFRESFDQASKPLLQNGMFRKVSSSFIINLAQVDGVTKNGFLMKDGTEITVSRLYSSTKKDFTEILAKKGRITYDF